MQSKPFKELLEILIKFCWFWKLLWDGKWWEGSFAAKKIASTAHSVPTIAMWKLARTTQLGGNYHPKDENVTFFLESSNLYLGRISFKRCILYKGTIDLKANEALFLFLLSSIFPQREKVFPQMEGEDICQVYHSSASSPNVAKKPLLSCQVCLI